MNIVNGFWIGKLGTMEELTIKSFIDNSCVFNLWSYDKEVKNLPEFTVLRDANEIMPYSEVFKYPPNMNTKFGNCGYVGTSEVFRYKLLYEKGGWWTDMDVTCLKNLSIYDNQEYFFRSHGKLLAAGNIMKCPEKSDLMKFCYEESKEKINEKCTDWFLGMNILCKNIEKLNLSKYVLSNVCNLDLIKEVEGLIRGNDKIPQNWSFIHWLNTIIKKNYYKSKSEYDNLIKKYNCSITSIL